VSSGKRTAHEDKRLVSYYYSCFSYTYEVDGKRYQERAVPRESQHFIPVPRARSRIPRRPHPHQVQPAPPELGTGDSAAGTSETAVFPLLKRTHSDVLVPPYS